jgi:DNA invertase Pin-like site-specific DNA recombinase
MGKHHVPLVDKLHMRKTPEMRRKMSVARSRLTPEQQEQVRAMRAAGVRNKDVAAHFGIDRPTVCHITRGMR